MAKILVAGDFCLNARMTSMMQQEVEEALQEIKPILQSVDYSLVNLECSVSNNHHLPISKCGPNLLNSSVILDAIKGLGFDAVTMANNHIADFGHEAMIDTLTLLEERGLDYVGAGKNIADASKVLYKQIDTKKIAFINCCEYEFTIATETIGGANPLNLPSIARDILAAKKCADYVIVIIHGGPEHYNLPTPRMQDTYRFFVEMGADVVINHHQHCYSGYEQYKGGYIVYGLGNFCFDSGKQGKSSWNEGYLAILDISEKIDVEFIPYVQCVENPGLMLLSDTKEFKENFENLSSIIKDPAKIQTKYSEFVNSKTEEYLYSFSLPQNRLMKRLKKMRLISSKFSSEVLPHFLTKERQLLFRSYFQCESHRDLMREILKKI